MIRILEINNNNSEAAVRQAMLTAFFPDVLYSFACSCSEGISKARSEQFDLILLDLMEPVSEGLETCRLIRGDTDLKMIPVIILSAEGTDFSGPDRALLAEVDRFLKKPVEDADLISAVSALMSIKWPDDQVTSERKLLEQTVTERTRSLQVQLEELKRTERELKNSFAVLETTKMATLNLMEDLKNEIDQRKLSEAILKESQHKYQELSNLFRSISDNMTDMLWAKDLEKKFIFANKAICDNLLQAKSTDEPIGRTDLFFALRQRMLHPDDPQWHTFGELCQNSDQVILDTGRPGQFDEFGNVNGNFLYLDVRKSPLYNEEGKIIGTVGSAQDITNERKMKSQLEQSERQLSALISNLPGMVYRCMNDDRGSMLFISDGCMNITDFQREFFIEKGMKRYHEMLPDEYRKSRWKKWQDALSTGERFDGEYPIRTAAGETKWVWERGRGIYNDLGEPVYLDGYIEDISVRKTAEVVIKKLNDELEQRVHDRTSQLEAANKELEAFSYSVSHDLRAPLRAIDGFTRILFEDYEPMLDEEGKRVCTVIQENAIRMGQLIDDLLALSQLNRADLSLTKINMDRLVRTVISEITGAEEKSRIRFNISHLNPAMGDQVLVRQIMVNLLSNAIKFSAQRDLSIIGVSSEKQKDMVVYSVSDNGAGFDMRYRDKLFGAFQRLHSIKEFDGTGIGLAIVQRIVHRHGGNVWAEGEVDKGATFSFSLPSKTEISK